MPRSKAATAAAPSRANGRARVDQLGGVISAEAYPTGLKTQRRDRADYFPQFVTALDVLRELVADAIRKDGAL